MLEKLSISCLMVEMPTEAHRKNHVARADQARPKEALRGGRMDVFQNEGTPVFHPALQRSYMLEHTSCIALFVASQFPNFTEM